MRKQYYHHILSGKKGRYLNMLSAMSGIAAILSPFLAGRLLHARHSWRFVYYTGLILLIPIALYFISLRAPGRQNTDEGNSHSGPLSQIIRRVLSNSFEKDFVLMYLINFMYMAAEMGLTTWLVVFLYHRTQLCFHKKRTITVLFSILR